MKKITASRGADGNWYIRIQNARNGRTVADGGEGYTFEVIVNTPYFISFRMVPRVAAPAR